ncbi:F-box protein At5g07610-like [Apium graveolens]|uniref:F-box protein At5g07610-like n=1 Tax=Apium graveolens TaxID=4045 RepID=UPI003D7A0C46
MQLDSPHQNAYFVPLDDQTTPSPFRPPLPIQILQSCNGLLLCSDSLESMFCVYNLSTNHLATLPRHPLGYRGNRTRGYGLAYDPLKSLYYKVIAFGITDGSNSIDNLHIYSSETGTWKASMQSFIPSPGKIITPGVYWNGCIFWLSETDCFYFSVEEERLEEFPRPPISASGTWEKSYFGESEDHLHVIDEVLNDPSLIVYEMKSDYSEWFIKYQIDLGPICKVFPDITTKSVFPLDNYKVAVLSIIRREKFREDSFLVMEIPGKVIRYNLVDRSFKLIWDFSGAFKPENFKRRLPGRFQVCQYSESVS